MDMVEEKRAIKVIAIGRVQKVGYRNFIFEKAIELSLCGFVKNRSDGTVFVHAFGTNLQLDEFLEWCQRGSPIAKVEKLEVTAVEDKGYENFKIIR